MEPYLISPPKIVSIPEGYDDKLEGGSQNTEHVQGLTKFNKDFEIKRN